MKPACIAGDLCDQEYYLLVVVARCSGDSLGLDCIAKSAHSVSRKQRNKAMHSLNGNTARATARKRLQKKDALDLQSVMHLLQQLMTLLQLLKGQNVSSLFSLLSGFQTGEAEVNEKGKTAPKKKKAKKPAKQSVSNTKVIQKEPDPPKPQVPRTYAEVAKQSGKSVKSSQQEKEKESFQPFWNIRSSDWNGEILTFEQLASKLPSAKEELKSVTLVDSSEALSELKTLVEAGRDDLTKVGVTAVILASHKVPGLEDNKPTQVPGLIAGKLTPRLAHVLQLGDDAPTLRKKVQTAKEVPASSDTTMVRLCTEARYHTPQKWQSLVDSPAPAARRWLQNHVPTENIRKVHDLWGMQLETAAGGGQAVISASLRVDRTVLNSILALSGRDAWYVEPMRWDYDKTPSCSINWIKKNQDEAVPDYALRVAGMAGTLGIARGWKSLGVRVPRAKDEKDKARLSCWRVAGIPREWDHETVLKEMKAAGLQDVQMTSRKRFGKTTTLFVMAKSSEKLDFVELTFDKVTVLATAQAPARGSRTVKTPLKTPSGLSFPQGLGQDGDREKTVHKSFYAASPVKKKHKGEDGSSGNGAVQSVPPTQLDHEDDEMKEKGAASPKAPPRKALQRPVPAGMTRVPNAAEGNCLFESIAQAISPEQPKPHMAVRTSVISHMKRHADHYKCWWDGLNPDGKVGTTWDDYTSKVSKNLAWAGSLELAAAAARYGRPIQVLGPHMMHSEVYNRNSKKNSIFLWYTTEPGHYEWLSGTPPADLQSCAMDRCKVVEVALKLGRVVPDCQLYPCVWMRVPLQTPVCQHCLRSRSSPLLAPAPAHCPMCRGRPSPPWGPHTALRT